MPNNNFQLAEAFKSVGESMANLGKLLAERESHNDAPQPVVAKKRVKRDVNAPKKNYSSYLHYCMANRERVMKAHPAMAQPDVAKLLGEEWRNLSDAEKEPYRKSAVDDKVRYDNEMASYKPASKGEDSQEATAPAKKKARARAEPKPAPVAVEVPAAASTTDDEDEEDEEKEEKVKEKKAEKKAKKAKKNKKDKK